MKDLGKLLKQAKDIQDRVAEAQAALERLEVEGQSGGGLVVAVMNGKGDLKRLKIDRGLLKPDEVEILEDLIVAAHNDAKEKAQARAAAEMSKVTSGLPLPPGFKFPV